MDASELLRTLLACGALACHRQVGASVVEDERLAGTLLWMQYRLNFPASLPRYQAWKARG